MSRTSTLSLNPGLSPTSTQLSGMSGPAAVELAVGPEEKEEPAGVNAPTHGRYSFHSRADFASFARKQTLVGPPPPRMGPYPSGGRAITLGAVLSVLWLRVA